MFAHLSLKARLWLLGIVAALGMSLLAASSIFFSSRSEGLFVNFVDERIAMRHVATLAYANGLQKGQAIRNILLDPGKQTAYDNFAKAQKIFDSEIEKLLPILAEDEAMREMAAQIKENVARWQPLQQKVIDLVRAGSTDEARTLLVAEETPAWRKVRGNLLEVVELAHAAAEAERNELVDVLARLRSA